MTNIELKEIRKELKFSMQDMADSLNKIPKATYQSYEEGRCKIPGDIADEVQAILTRNRHLDDTRIQRVDDWIQQQFPNGIMSEVACG